jgi:hypothetical protein
MITTIALIVGSMALGALAVAAYWALDAHRTEVAAAESERISEALSRYELGPAKRQCDCCGRLADLSRCWAYGIETFACEACRGG